MAKDAASSGSRAKDKDSSQVFANAVAEAIAELGRAIDEFDIHVRNSKP